MNKFWKWYDEMEEPWRMLFGVGVVCSPLHISAYTGIHWILFLLLPIIASRMLYSFKHGK